MVGYPASLLPGTTPTRAIPVSLLFRVYTVHHGNQGGYLVTAVSGAVYREGALGSKLREHTGWEGEEERLCAEL